MCWLIGMVVLKEGNYEYKDALSGAMFLMGILESLMYSVIIIGVFI